ncbi:MAG: hypothetical protein ACYC25_01720 [Paludibacter sp.]
MYPILLILHSSLRWLILFSFLYALIRAYYGWLANQKFNKLDSKVLLITSSLAHLQLVIGIVLYFVSPVVSYFLHNFKTAVHQEQFRFFGMEHALMMLIAITIITIGSVIAKRKATDKGKFRTIAIWYSVGIILIVAFMPNW